MPLMQLDISLLFTLYLKDLFWESCCRKSYVLISLIEKLPNTIFLFYFPKCFILHSLKGGVIGIHINKDTFCSVRTPCLHPPTPIPILCLRKQVNQTQKPVGCETSLGPTLGHQSHQSFNLDFDGKPRKHIQKSHPALSLASSTLC